MIQALLLTVFVVLVAVSLIAAYRDAREMDRQEAAIDAAALTLDVYAPRAIPVGPPMTTTGALGKERPAAVITARGE